MKLALNHHGKISARQVSVDEVTRRGRGAVSVTTAQYHDAAALIEWVAGSDDQATIFDDLFVLVDVAHKCPAVRGPNGGSLLGDIQARSLLSQFIQNHLGLLVRLWATEQDEVTS